MNITKQMVLTNLFSQKFAVKRHDKNADGKKVIVKSELFFIKFVENMLLFGILKI